LPNHESGEGLPARGPAASWRQNLWRRLADHVKNLDWQARGVVFEAKAPAEILTDVRERLRVLLGL
jgi:hypothetical protein